MKSLKKKVAVLAIAALVSAPAMSMTMWDCGDDGKAWLCKIF
jgi:hypothetical protein